MQNNCKHDILKTHKSQHLDYNIVRQHCTNYMEEDDERLTGNIIKFNMQTKQHIILTDDELNLEYTMNLNSIQAQVKNNRQRTPICLKYIL